MLKTLFIEFEKEDISAVKYLQLQKHIIFFCKTNISVLNDNRFKTSFPSFSFDYYVLLRNNNYDLEKIIKIFENHFLIEVIYDENYIAFKSYLFKYNNFYNLDKYFFFKNYYSKILSKNAYIPSIKNYKIYSININNYCNLRCKRCSHFCFKNKNENISSQQLEKLYLLIKNRIKMDCLVLIGGETLLHPDLINLIKLTRKYYPNLPIQIFTNGILLQDENKELLECFKNNYVIIYISYYFNINYEKIINLLNKYEIARIFVPKPVFFDNLLTEEIKEYPNPLKNYNNCEWHDLHFILLKNKWIVTPCSSISFGKYLNKKYENLLIPNKDYFFIEDYKEDEKWQNISFCKYCNNEFNKRYNNLEGFKYNSNDDKKYKVWHFINY